MSNEVSPDQMQARIQQARREAENLKDRIKRKKDELADGTRKNPINREHTQLPELLICRVCDYMLINLYDSLWHCQESARSSAQESNDEDPENVEGTSCEDLRHALVNRPETPGISITGRKAHHLGCIHNQQSSRHTTTIIVGHDLRICPQRKLRRLWWPRQHLLNLQPEFDPRWTHTRCARAFRTFWIPFLLSVHQ